jgi:hypothetical protein
VDSLADTASVIIAIKSYEIIDSFSRFCFDDKL